jgi:peptide/nickel transport system permease protein
VGRYIAKRLLHALFVLLAVSLVVFLIAHLSGDPSALFLGDNGTPDDLARIRHLLGLDKPLYMQYWIFLTGALRGDLGHSIWQQEPALKLVLDRLPATLQLALTAFVLSIVFAVPAGVFAALRRGKAGDWGVIGVTVLGQSVPVFVLGVLLVLLFAVKWKLLPPSGSGTWRHLVLPSLSLALFSSAKVARLTRTSVLEILGKDYVRTAKGKGAGRQRVIWVHVLRNAALPIVTIAGLELGALLSGVVVTETIFGWPGIGRLAIEAISHRDYPVIQAEALFVASIFVLINILIDMTYIALNPRIRLGGGGEA